MSVARSSTRVVGGDDLDAGERLDGAARRRDASDGLQLREELLRGGRELHDELPLEGEEVIGAVEVCTAGGSACSVRVPRAHADVDRTHGVCQGRRSGPVPCTPASRGAQEGSGTLPGRAACGRGQLDGPHDVVASGSAARRSAARRQACRTVVWLRPPKARPIGGEASRRCARARGTWRPGAARRRGRRGSSTGAPRALRPKAAAVRSWIARLWAAGRRRCRRRRDAVAPGRRGRGRRGPRRRAAGSSGRPVSEAKATTRMSAPSSARTLVVTRSAIRSRTAWSCERDAVVGDALAQHGQAGPAVGRLDVGDEAGLEALAQAVLERRRGRAGAGRR